MGNCVKYPRQFYVTEEKPVPFRRFCKIITSENYTLYGAGKYYVWKTTDCDELKGWQIFGEDGKMIGEGILWNFGADGSAELGCRILPEYHGNGYGKKAFGAIADFAEKSLNLKLWARCFRQNKSSEKMILASGFEEFKSDDTFHYFERNAKI